MIWRQEEAVIRLWQQLADTRADSKDRVCSSFQVTSWNNIRFTVASTLGHLKQCLVSLAFFDFLKARSSSL